MKILLVEDDAFHAKVIRSALESHFTPAPEITHLKTEKEYRRRFEEIQEGGYDLAIFDQMLPWTTEDDENYNDGDAPEDGPLRAGSRCYQLLVTDEKTKRIPAMFLTNLERRAAPEGAPYVRKKDDPDLVDTLAAIERLVGNST